MERPNLQVTLLNPKYQKNIWVETTSSMAGRPNQRRLLAIFLNLLVIPTRLVITAVILQN